MNNQKSFKRIFILLFVPVVGFVFAAFFLFQQIKGKNQFISASKQQLALQDKKQEYLTSTQHLLESRKDDITAVTNSILSMDGDVAFIESLENLAKSNNLTMEIESLTFDNTITPVSSNLVNFKIRGKTNGSFSDNYRFIKELEASPIKVKLNRVSISNTGNQEGKSLQNIWQASFDIQVLKYK